MFRMVQKMCSPSFQDVPGLQLLTASPHEAPEARLQMTLVERKSVARRIKVFLGQVRLNGVLMSFDDVNDFRNSWTVQKKRMGFLWNRNRSFSWGTPANETMDMYTITPIMSHLPFTPATFPNFSHVLCNVGRTPWMRAAITNQPFVRISISEGMENLFVPPKVTCVWDSPGKASWGQMEASSSTYSVSQLNWF